MVTYCSARSGRSGRRPLEGRRGGCRKGPGRSYGWASRRPNEACLRAPGNLESAGSYALRGFDAAQVADVLVLP
jgi:hypothetical protein